MLFAGGSGITPVYSIILSLLEKEPNSKILLVYANRNLDSIIFKKELETLITEYPGRITIEHLIQVFDEHFGDFVILER